MSFMCHLFLEIMWQQGKEFVRKVYDFTLFSCMLSYQTLSSKFQTPYKFGFDFDFFTLAVSQENFQHQRRNICQIEDF